MTADTAHRLVSEALKRPLGSERTAYLDGACGDDRELRLEVEAKLRSEARRIEDVTAILFAVRAGESGAIDDLVRRVYDELRRMASGRMARERAAPNRQATELVHEAFLRLFRGPSPSWENRKHFFGSAARAMERVLVEWARVRASKKRGGDQKRVALEEADVTFDRNPTQDIAISEALKELEAHDERQALVVRLRYFVGLTVEEAAEIIGVSPRTVKSDWSFARAWLHQKLTEAVSG